MHLKKLLSFEWDAIAGILAAVIALILHLLHIVDEHVILPIVLALIALLLINFMRHTRNNEITAAQVDHALQAISNIQSTLKTPDVAILWAILKKVSLIKVDLPEPDTPVTQVKRPMGMVKSTLRRLLPRAPNNSIT